MKTIYWLGLTTALILPLVSLYGQAPPPDSANNPPPPPNVGAVPADLSPGVTEVMRLAEAGTTDEVMMSYIQGSTAPFNLNADQILYLRDIGLSSQVITAMLNRDNAMRNQPQTYSYDQKLYTPSTPPPQVAPVATAPPVPENPAPPPAEPAPLAAPAPVYVSSPPPDVTYFYNDLSPYGTWVQLDGVGWCWQPRVVVVNRAWRPYCDAGHWIYTDAGWYWESDYSWGWAPFHYGRWHLHQGCGWVWVPERVWAPAWVVWRSEGDYCGWAPLPPHAEFVAGFGWRFNGISVGVNFDFGLHPDHYTFIALHDFHDHDFAHHRLPPTQVTQIYNHTTIINNYVVNNNKTIVNQGIKVDRVAAATHTTIRPVHLRDAPDNAARSLNGRPSQKGELMVYRPQLKAPAKPVAMVAQKVDERHPVIQHQPVAPSRPERTASLGSAPYAPATGYRSPQAPSPRATRPNLENPSPNSKTRSAPNPHPPAPSAPASSRSSQFSSVAPRETPAREPAPGSSVSATRPQAAAPEVQAPRSAPTARPEPNSQLYPLRSGPRNPPAYGRQDITGQGSGYYYPKSYHQASEAHSFSPGNPQQSDRSSPGSGRGQSKKNDQ